MSFHSPCPQLLSHEREGILVLTIQRPEKRNALSVELYSALCAALAAAEADDGVRVVVLQGSGGSFTSGNDLGDFLKSPPTGDDSPVLRFLQAISTFPKPLVAAVCGAAVGIGTTLLLHCDLVCASPSARFELPFVKLGLCPEAGASLLLPRLVGHQQAAELLLLGDTFDAERAMSLGLVNRLVAEDELFDCALALARQLAQQPPAAVRLTKALLKRHAAADLAATIREEGEHFVRRLASPEARQALTAFFARRPPQPASEA